MKLKMKVTWVYIGYLSILHNFDSSCDRLDCTFYSVDLSWPWVTMLTLLLRDCIFPKMIRTPNHRQSEHCVQFIYFCTKNSHATIWSVNILIETLSKYCHSFWFYIVDNTWLTSTRMTSTLKWTMLMTWYRGLVPAEPECWSQLVWRHRSRRDCQLCHYNSTTASLTSSVVTSLRCWRHCNLVSAVADL